MSAYGLQFLIPVGRKKTLLPERRGTKSSRERATSGTPSDGQVPGGTIDRTFMIKTVSMVKEGASDEGYVLL